ncbi:MAG: T9SS type A sorting domain-containing protein [Bacteroidota bacterium]
MQLKRIILYLLTATIFFQCKHHDKIAASVSSEEESEELDGMERAMHQEFMMTRDLNINAIPSGRLMAAQAYMQNLISTARTAQTMALTWQERGPNNVGGRTRAILVDKRDATGNTVFAGSVSGGLFKTTNFTSPSCSWAPINDFLPNMAITCLVQDNTTPTIMYAGTGEGWFNSDAVLGHGIYKSTDGGVTWNVLPSTIKTTPSDSTFQFVQDMVIDNNGNLYAAIRNSTDPFTPPSFARGVKRSNDGGITWTQVLGAPLTNPETFTTGRAADLEVASNGDVYATLGVFGRGSIWKSSFATFGANTGAFGNWLNITPPWVRPRFRIELAIAPSNSQRLYAFAHDSTTDQVIGLYRSFNGGNSWDSVSTPDPINNGPAQAWYDLIAAVDPNNPDILIAGGINLGKSTDAGITWSEISTSATVHVDHHFLQYIGSNKLINGNDGGIYYSENINLSSPTFTNKNNGYNVTQFYACDIHPTTTNYFLAGAQDNRTQKFTNSGINSTTVATSGDGGVCHIDQTNGLLQITSNTGNRYFVSTNGGTSFSNSGIQNDRGQFINPTDFDDNAKILYCGDDPGKYFFVTNWSGSPSGTVATVALMGSREVTAVKVDPFAANTIWIGASFGDPSLLAPMVLKIANANTASPTVFNNSTIPGVPAGAAISSIDIDPANGEHILVTISNYGTASVFESINGGSNWTNIEGNIPDMPVRWGIFAPANAQLNGGSGGNGGILVGTELGVWTTSQINGASTQWIANNSGLANVPVYMLRYRASDKLVAAATHGRGLFTTTLTTVITGIPNIPITKDFIKYISAENGQLQIVVGNLPVKDITVQLYDMNGRLVDNRKNQYQNSIVNIQRLSAGSYVVKITGDKKENFVQQFIKR